MELYSIGVDLGGTNLRVEVRTDLYNVFNHQRVAMVGGAQMNPSVWGGHPG